MKILLTGFDPFGNDKINPSWEAVKKVSDTIGGHEVHKLEIPTVFGRSADTIFAKIEELDPDYVISIGQAGGRADMTVEFVGINWADARIPDNDNKQPLQEKLYEDGENAYFADIPVAKIVSEIRAKNIPCSVSYTAGTYVCNDVLYALRYYCEKNSKKYKSGFMHVPFIPEQAIDKPASTPTMSLDNIVIAIETAVEACVSDVEADKVALGTTH